jgi:diacylglycerol O-acyltransferase
METREQSDRLSWGDTVFLNLEREGMPLNVASICVFEGEVSFKDCMQFIESKLPLIPRYLKRVVAAPFGLGLPTWEYDPHFKLSRHVKEVKLKNGSEAELKELAGKLFSQVMDRQHPLWDLTLVRGLNGSRTALIIRLHHCMADGVAGVGIMNVLLDANPQAPRLPKKKLKFSVPKPPDPIASLSTGFVESYTDFVQRILSALADLLSMAERVAASTSNGSGGGAASLPTSEIVSLFPELTAMTERLRFNVLYQGPQKFAFTSISLPEIKAIKESCGASVNDVILAIVTATIRRYCELHGDSVKGKLLRIMVPVNLRGSQSTSDMGNRISLVPVTIPLDIRQPLKLLAAAHKRAEFLKRVHAAELVSLAGGLIGMFPSSAQGLVGPLVSRLPITPFNLVCTNVPGPQFPLYLMGHKMVQCYPYVPVGGEMALNCAILTYNGTAYFGFSGDSKAAPDLHEMERLLQESFAELREAATVTPSQSKGQRRGRKQSAATAAVNQPVAAAAETQAAENPPANEVVAPDPVEEVASAPKPRTQRRKAPTAPRAKVVAAAPRKAQPERVPTQAAERQNANVDLVFA